MITKLFFDLVDIWYRNKQNPKPVIKKYSVLVNKLKNVRYHKSKNSKLDIYIPKKEMDKYPVHVYIHGGGFTSGNKKYREALSLYLANESDNIVMPVEYTKSPKFTFEQSIKQLLKVFDFIYENADVYHFDLNRVSVGGDSAGAFFALYLALATTNKDLQNRLDYICKFRVNKAMLNCGVYNYKTAKFSPKIAKYYYGIIESVTHLKFEEIDSSPMKDLFVPLNYINEDTSEMLLCFSKQDIFCSGQSEELMTYLDKYKIKYNYYFCDDAHHGHCFSLGWKSRKAKEFNNMYKDFLKGE